MNTVNVKKEDLLKAMKANREEHRKIFLEAQEGYREAVIEKLDEMLERARGKHPFDIQILFRMTQPEDHTDEYDTIIGMLEMDINPSVELDARQFKCWVLDEWDWSRSFATSNSGYSAYAATKFRSTL